MAHDTRAASYDILERLARNLPDRDDCGVGEAIQEVPQRLSTLPNLGRARPTIRMRRAGSVRVPRERIPQYGAIGNTQIVQTSPDDRRARLGPWTHSVRDTFGRAYARDPMFQQQSFTGESDARETAALIAGGLAYQHERWTTRQVLFKTSQTPTRCIIGAIQQIGFQPGIEHIGRREALQKLEQRPVCLWIQAARLGC